MSPGGVHRYFFLRVWWFLQFGDPPIKEHLSSKNPPIKEHFQLQNPPIKEHFPKKWPIEEHHCYSKYAFCVNFRKSWRRRRKIWEIRPLKEHFGLIRPFKEHFSLQNPPFQEHFARPDPPIKEHLVLKNPPLFHQHTRISKYQVPPPGSKKHTRLCTQTHTQKRYIHKHGIRWHSFTS